MRKLFPFLVVLLLVAGLLCTPLLFRLERYRIEVADSLSQRLNHKVVIGRMEGSLFPPSVKLYDVALLSPSGDSPLLQIEQVTAPVNWKALLRARLVPQSLTFRGWQAHLRRNVDGSWAWDEWLVPTTQLGAKAGWPLARITLERGECRAQDPYGPGPEEFVIQVLQGGWESSRQYISVNGVLPGLPGSVSFLFQGSGKFISNPDWTAVLELTDDQHRQCKFDWKVVDGRSEAASGQSAQWRMDTAYTFLRYYGRLPLPISVPSPALLLENWKSSFDWHGSTLTFTHSAGLAEGHAEATGGIFFRPSRSAAHIDLAVQDVKIKGIESMFWGKAPLEGTATGLARFELVLSTNPWGSVNGEGALAFKDGRYFWPETSIRSLSKAHIMRYLSRKYPAFQQNGLAYAKAGFHWQVRRGVFSFNDAFCTLGDVQIALAGQYDAERKGVDAYARVQVQERNPQLLKELPPSYVYKGDGAPRIQPMHGHIQGTPNEWYLRTVRSTKVPAGLRAQLSKAIRSK